ncbi:MAG: FHA domain-containing protein [Thermoflexales bacterium]|nr:FHA domain-containing protein [Thermoflexales bacterium]MDW8293541.1 FHA domain-containing protein [Anaerolineae bacterium]
MVSSTSPSDTPAVLQSNLRESERYVLAETRVSIGRTVTGQNDIVLSPDDLTASRQHATLTLEGNTWVIEDHSRNGTRVNDRVLRHERLALHHGDRIRIGHTFDVTFYIVGETQWTRESDWNVDELANRASFLNEAPPVTTGLWLSPNAAVWRDGVRLPVWLSRTEYRLLKHLMQHAGNVCEYAEIIKAVWNDKARSKDNVHELVYRVRHKIEPIPSQPRYLLIRSGIGLVLFPQGAPEEELA